MQFLVSWAYAHFYAPHSLLCMHSIYTGSYWWAHMQSAHVTSIRGSVYLFKNEKNRKKKQVFPSHCKSYDHCLVAFGSIIFYRVAISVHCRMGFHETQPLYFMGGMRVLVLDVDIVIINIKCGFQFWTDNRVCIFICIYVVMCERQWWWLLGCWVQCCVCVSRIGQDIVKSGGMGWSDRSIAWVRMRGCRLLHSSYYETELSIIIIIIVKTNRYVRTPWSIITMFAGFKRNLLYLRYLTWIRVNQKLSDARFGKMLFWYYRAQSRTTNDNDYRYKFLWLLSVSSFTHTLALQSLVSHCQ